MDPFLLKLQQINAITPIKHFVEETNNLGDFEAELLTFLFALEGFY